MPKRLWLMLREPRVVTAITSACWGVALAIGVVTLIVPPLTITAILGHMTALMAIIMIVGGTLGLAGCLSGWWWIERMGIIAAGTSTAIYAYTLLALHFGSDGSRLTQLGFVLWAAGSLAARWFRIQGGQVDPTRGMDRQGRG